MHPLRLALRTRPARTAALAAPAATALLLLTGTTAYANVTVTQVSQDIYTDAQAQHNTEVEPDTFASGSTIVSAFQVGRVSGGGASNIGWATSTDGGATWTHGYLPGITTNGGGPFGQASDASVAYDAKHNVWLISSLGVSGSAVDVLTSRSTDGGLTWSNPVTTATGSNDKNWIVCDDTATSPHYGNCYTEYDITSSGDSIRMRTSTDGGATWGAALAPGGSHTGLGGQPVVLPNGDVVVPYESLGQLRSAPSAPPTAAASWTSTVLVSSISHHTVAGSLREQPLPSAEVDAAGTVYVAWADCRFRVRLPKQRHRHRQVHQRNHLGRTGHGYPIDADHQHRRPLHHRASASTDSTSGSSARIGLTYYYYPTANCTASTCQLDVGYISSVNGGTSWSAATQLAGPMTLSWLPNTSQGRMFGDYISTSIVAGGNAYPVIPIANAPTGSTFDLAMYIPAGGLAITGGTNAAGRAKGNAAGPATRPSTPAYLTAR